MANNLTSNVTTKLARVFLEAADNERVLSKSVDTRLLTGKFNPASGDTYDVKRPHDYNTISTADGDISGSTKSGIISGKATATVQHELTVAVEWGEVEEALHLDQLDQILAPAAKRLITQHEINFADYMKNNCGLKYGTPGTAVDAWSDVAGAADTLRAHGFDPSDACYVMNTFTQTALADAQNGLYANANLVGSAWERAQVSANFGGIQTMQSQALGSYTLPADVAGAIHGTPTATYVGHKDSMIQSIAVDGFTGTQVIPAGAYVEVTAGSGSVSRFNLATRQSIMDNVGANIKWGAVVTESVTLVGGAGTLKVAGPAIYEANGQYNTVSQPLADNDVITVLGAASATYQPNLFFQKQAFGVSYVKLPKLYATDTIATTKDGLSIRVTKYSDGDAAKQKVRFDLMPAFATFDPFKAGHGYGA